MTTTINLDLAGNNPTLLKDLEEGDTFIFIVVGKHFPRSQHSVYRVLDTPEGKYCNCYCFNVNTVSRFDSAREVQRVDVDIVATLVEGPR